MKKEIITLTPEQKGRILDIKANIQRETANMDNLSFVEQTWMKIQIEEWNKEIKDIKNGRL